MVNYFTIIFIYSWLSLLGMPAWDALGITEQELAVYQALLKHGASSVSGLAHKTHLNERSAYDYLERLICKGLVGQALHNNKRIFLGLNPLTLGYLIDEQKQQIANAFDRLASKRAAAQSNLLMHIIYSEH